jgi:hypothetical protein
MSEHVIHRGVGLPTTCRSCKASIVFARMASSGKLSPFELDAAGEWSLVNGVATHVGKAPEPAIPGVETVPRYASHFAKCPAASSWRKR